tara:strand:- start:1322 stop:1525 length:204 start_codon:yes stop_codon:yes gene_type:complete
MKDKMKRLAENILKSEKGIAGASMAANPIRNLPGIIKIQIAKKMTKPKKMNMGGVVSGRGGSFKGTK